MKSNFFKSLLFSRVWFIGSILNISSTCGRGRSLQTSNYFLHMTPRRLHNNNDNNTRTNYINYVVGVIFFFFCRRPDVPSSRGYDNFIHPTPRMCSSARRRARIHCDRIRLYRILQLYVYIYININRVASKRRGEGQINIFI